MKYLLFALMLLCVACSTDNSEDPYTPQREVVRTLDSTLVINDLTANCYRSDYNGYIIYEPTFIHTDTFLTYFFTYKIQLLDVKGLVMLESSETILDSPEANKIYYGVSLNTGDPAWVPISRIVITNFTAKNSAPQ